MINTKELTYALLIGGIAIATAYSQNKDSEYVAPPDAGPKGKAPRMKFQSLNPGEKTKQYAVIFYQGDEAFSGLLEFAQKYHVTSAHFTAIGAVNGATQGGHVLAAYVYPTLEVMVTVDPVTMQKRFDPDTDLTLIDPSPASKGEK